MGTAFTNSGSIEVAGSDSRVWITNGAVNTGSIALSDKALIDFQYVPWSNAGTISVSDGATVSTYESWTNTGAILGKAGGTVWLGGSGSVNIRGSSS